MVEKYVLVLPDEIVFAIKFLWKEEKVIIGGKSRLYNIIEEIIKDYFDCPIPEINFTQVNKCRYILENINKIKFSEVKKNFEKGNFVLEKVNSLGTIMR